MNVTIAQLIKQYPPAQGLRAVVGKIPMDEFEAMEKEIRPEMRKLGLRAIFRGPRTGSWACSTLRKDATHVTFYAYD